MDSQTVELCGTNRSKRSVRTTDAWSSLSRISVVSITSQLHMELKSKNYWRDWQKSSRKIPTKRRSLYSSMIWAAFSATYSIETGLIWFQESRVLILVKFVTKMSSSSRKPFFHSRISCSSVCFLLRVIQLRQYFLSFLENLYQLRRVLGLMHAQLVSGRGRCSTRIIRSLSIYRYKKD